jgi:hypothetical protein
MGILNDLYVRIKGDSSDLDKTLDKSSGRVQSWAGKIGSWVKGALAVGAIVQFGRAIIDASDKLSDKFTFAMSGAREAANFFMRSIANVDFSNLIGGLIESYKRGSDLAKKLDELAERKAYDDFVTLTMKRSSSELRETIKNKELDISVRAAAAAERQKIEEDIYKRTGEIAQKTFDLESAAWESRNKNLNMSAAEAVAIIKRWQESMATDDLMAIWNKAYKVYGSKKDVFGARESFIKSQLIDPSIFESFQKYYDITTKGEKDVIQKLFEVYSVFEETKIEAQERLNAAIKETSGLIQQENKLIQEGPSGPVLAPKSDFMSGGESPRDIMLKSLESQASAGRISDAFYSVLDRMQKPQQDIINSTNDWGNEWRSSLNFITDMVADSIENIGQAFSGGISGKELGRELLVAFADFLSMMGKMMITAGIMMSGLFKALANPLNPLGWMALVGLGAAALLTAGLIKGAISSGAAGVTGGTGSANNSNAGNIQQIKVMVEGKISGRDIVLSSRRYSEERR